MIDLSSSIIKNIINTQKDKFHAWNNRRLKESGEIEYLFISIYRVDFSVIKSRKGIMQNIILHFDNKMTENKNLKTEAKLVNRFSTIFNNRILGLEVQNASIYGSKIQLAFDDYDKKLASSIRKNDLIIVHRLNSKKLRRMDAFASVLGFGTYYPSGIKDGAIATGATNAVKSKFTQIINNKLDGLTNDFLKDEKPIFSGLITKPAIVMGSSIKLTIEAQDMVRIMQHINTEDRENDRYENIPVNLDEFLLTYDFTKGMVKIKGTDHIQIFKSYILNTLSDSIMDNIKSFNNVNDMNRAGIQFTKYNLSEIDLLPFIKNDVIINSISNGMHLIHVTPLKAIKLFVEYYAKNTGINIFFDINTWNTDFMGDRSIINHLYEFIYKDSISGISPYFTFGIILETDDSISQKYGVDFLTSDISKFGLFKKFDKKYIFTDQSFDMFHKYRAVESVLISKYEGEERDYEHIIAEFFLHLVRASSVTSGNTTKLVTSNLTDLYLTNNTSQVISSDARQLYQETLEMIKNEFASTLSLNYIIHTNFSSVRSNEYNTLLNNQMKSIPITQVIQLFLGAMTVLPVSQQKTKTHDYENVGYNISQRIWLSSAIGFSKKETIGSKIINTESWVWEKGLKPTIYFGLNYKPGFKHNSSSDRITYVSDKDIINAEMYALPDNGNLSIYHWSTNRNINIGYATYKKGERGELFPPLSLGMTNLFDLQEITGGLNSYLSENIEKQIGGDQSYKNIPRVCLFKLNDKVDQTKNTNASTALARFDSFNMIPLGKTPYSIYLGYDMYGIHGEVDDIRLQHGSDLKLYLPLYDGSAKLLETDDISDLNTAFNSFDDNSNDDFPADKSVKFDSGLNKTIITGIQNYYDPTKLLPILRTYLHLMNIGFIGVSGDGNQNWYTDTNKFLTYHNIKIDNGSTYLDTYDLNNTDLTIKDIETSTIKSLTTKLIKWIEQFEGNEINKRKMMIKYAHQVAGIKKRQIINNDDSPIIMKKDSNGNDVVYFNPANLMSVIKIFKITNEKAKKTMSILVGFIRSVSHYMNKVTKQSVIGGVLYMPLKEKNDGEVFKLGDAITFINPNQEQDNDIFNKIKKIAIADNPPTDLSIYNKVYYVWKTTHYFGGAGTDPSGTSGNTMRVYITDSGIHWQSSYEENDITTKIAESMQLHRLSVGLT